MNIRRGPRGSLLARMLVACLVFVAPTLGAQASPAADDIVVVSLKGDVSVNSRGAAIAARAGSVLALAAAVQTGSDGSIDLRQGDTTIAVGPDTQLDFPAPAQARPIDRVVQPNGNAYYDVGPRGNRRLRVETPYLVAVIKGTQFNVAVTADSSTISLHEGRLEILATEGGIAPVQLNAGEIAVRRRGEASIRVLQLKNGGAGASSATSVDGDSTAALTATDTGGAGPGIPVDKSGIAGDDGGILGTDLPGSSIDPTDDATIDSNIRLDDLGAETTGADLGVDGSIDLGSGTLDADIGAGADLGGATVDGGVDAGVDLGAGEVDAGVDAGVDLGSAGAEIGADAGLDVGDGTVDAGFDAGVDAGAVGSDAGVDAAVDLGSGTIDGGIDAGVDLGGDTVLDTGADTGADTSAGTVDAGVDTDIGGVESGVDVDADLTGSDAGVDLGADVLGTEIDVGLGGGDDTGTGSEDAGGLLGGLLSGPRN